MTAPRGRVNVALVSASAVFFAAVAAWIPARASGRLSAAASVAPNLVASGHPLAYALTIRNTSSPPGQRVGSVQIAAPARWVINSCGAAPWSGRLDGGTCWFESERGGRDDIEPGETTTVVVVATVSAPSGTRGTWRVWVQKQDAASSGEETGGGDRVEVLPFGSGLTTTVSGGNVGTPTPTPSPSTSPSAAPSASPTFSEPLPSQTPRPIVTGPAPTPGPSPAPSGSSLPPTPAPSFPPGPAPPTPPMPPFPPGPGPAPPTPPVPVPTPSPPTPPECTQCGTPGDDVLEIGPGDMADGFEAITGGSGSDSVVATFVDPGTPWEMVIDAGGGADTIVISIEGDSTTAGSIVLRSGAGDDTVIVDSWAPVEISAGDGSDQIVCGWSGDVAALGAGADVARCRTGADTIRGGPGPDAMHGGRGGDVLRGGAGTDACFPKPRDRIKSCR